MRLAKLELIAYGPFRNVALDFSAPGIHVVLGRNEAGKSTTLRAITGLLYGIDSKTPDAHVHKFGDLRIGGVLESAAGERIRVVRRKGNTNTLLDDREQVLDESIMKKLLGGVSRETFTLAFGLDHETLEAGAKALLEGKGDLGESLFDASVGGGGEVQRLLADLTTEADKIYKPRASSLPLNDALKSFADAQKTVREKQSLPEAFLEQERGLREAIDERAARQATKKELETRRARLVRARRRAPLERRRDRALAERAELGAVTAQVPRVLALKDRYVVYERTLEQRRELLAESERLTGRVAEAARRAGVDPGGGTDGLRLDTRREARVHTLLSERTALSGRIEAAAVEIVRLERELTRLSEIAGVLPRAAATGSAAPSKATLDKTGKGKPKKKIESEALFGSREPLADRGNDGDAPTDRRPATSGQVLSIALDRARALGDIEVRIASERARIERRSKELEMRAAALGLFEGTLDAFVGLRLPAIVSVERLEARAEEIGRTIARLDERVADLEREAASIEKQTAGYSGDFAPPDAAALRAARGARDDAWKALCAAVDASSRRLAEVEMERLLREADVVADRMIREADRVTTLARLRSEAETNARQLEKVLEEKARAVRDREALGSELAALFADAKIEPRGFAEMRQWLERHAQIAEACAALRDARSSLLEEEAKAAAAKGDVARALSALGDEVADDVRLADLVAVAAERLAEIESLRRDAEDAARGLVEVRTKLDERIAIRTRDQSARGDVNAKLTELLAPLGIPADALAEEVNRSIEALRDLFAVVDKRAEVEARARVADADVRAFEADLSRALTELAPDLASMELRDAAPALFARGARARENAQELVNVEKQLENEGEIALDEAERALLSDPDAAARSEEELGDEIDEVEREISRLTERIGGLRNGLEKMRAESHAAEAASAAQLHLTRIRENTERWCRVKLAAVLLAREIERYREENQGPLLGSSSSLFSRLTLGAFAGIKAGFDDKDRPCLRCVRAGSGGEVDVEGLSDGTRDQLYLSLRLASLLRRTDMAEPMPLVLDDVLIQLDDQRASAALAVLAEVARKMQVLFFTHHARLVDLARASVATDELVIHELASALSPAESVASAPA